ncbi:MAG: hypothetical protein HWN65_17980 [Candidatus Helarchaeota archaeon]|nr:hypothetical protein [Candidatus Helarchaeota archaeon]
MKSLEGSKKYTFAQLLYPLILFTSTITVFILNIAGVWQFDAFDTIIIGWGIGFIVVIILHPRLLNKIFHFPPSRLQGLYLVRRYIVILTAVVILSIHLMKVFVVN